MLTAERIQEYTDLGYPVEKLVKSRRNKANNWQTKLAMSEIDPKSYKGKEIRLPGDVWNRANELRDATATEKHINQANAAVRAIKFKQKAEDWKTACIIMGSLWLYTASLAVVFYFTRL